MSQNIRIANNINCYRILLVAVVLNILADCVHSVRSADTPAHSIDSFNGVWTTFDGIGGISGGGATSKLLINYPEPYRSEVLDYLFKPQFGASLQILKVEIGGDSQSSDGSESSHMHSSDDANYNRGYEWWLMKEAKKRNPDIKLYGLPWTFPGWIGGGVFNPFINRTATVRYIINWIQGAWQQHGLSIDYIGVWNERTCDKEYVKLLRATLNKEGFDYVRIVAPDAQSWDILKDFGEDTDYVNAVDIIGQHYPGTYTPDNAFHFDKKLWASEEYSAYSDLGGAGCWARVLSESPVNGFYTGFIAWNLVTSYYNGLPYTLDSLMTANQPWSGHYEVASPIWITAHHTQFYQPGWYYLHHGHGVDRLHGNGTFISVTSPDQKHLTIVIETMDPNDSPCFYYMPKFNVTEQQNATFRLAGTFSAIKVLYVWYSRLDFSGNNTMLFNKRSPIQVVGGVISLVLNRNEIYTLSTDPVGFKGNYSEPPASAPFPVPYKDTFDAYNVGDEPFNLAQQSGAFEIQKSSSAAQGQVMAQVVSQPPVDTCSGGTFQHPLALIGDYTWSNVSVQIDVLINKTTNKGDAYASGVFLGSNLNAGGCDAVSADGVFLWVSAATGQAFLTENQKEGIIAETAVPDLQYGQWFTISVDVLGDRVTATFNGVAIMSVVVKQLRSHNGFVALGPDSFGVVYFDNLYISRADRARICAANEDESHGDCVSNSRPRTAVYSTRERRRTAV